MARRTFTREFKISAVNLVNQQGYTVTEAAHSLGVDPNSVRDWIAKLGGEEGGAAAPNGEASLRAQVQRLRKENARLVMERDILKKATAFFAKEQP